MGGSGETGVNSLIRGWVLSGEGCSGEFRGGILILAWIVDLLNVLVQN